MISGIIFTIGLLFAAAVFIGGEKTKVVKDRWGDDREKVNTSLAIKVGTIIALSIVVSIIQPFALERVDAGHVGIKVKLTGNARGVSNY